MTRDEIIRMAREAGYAIRQFDGVDEVMDGDNYHIQTDEVEKFAALVAAAEREACHALRQTLPNPHEHCQVSAHAYDMAIAAYGAAIHARGETK